MKEIKLRKVGMLKGVKYREDAVVYDSNGLARTMKCNGGGGNYIIYENPKSQKI